MGSKRRIAKHILPIMLAERMPGQWWVEPFVGGANMIDKVDGYRLGNDNHKYLIALLKAVQDGWIPPVNVSREMYYSVKATPDDYTDELVGFVGFLCSYCGIWWGGYAEDKRGYNYSAAGSRVLLKQAPSLEGIKFVCKDYLDLQIPSNSLIYCDPPYHGVTGYHVKFDHAVFWDWCRGKSNDGHVVFASEYSAPKDFKIIKEVELRPTVGMLNSGPKKIERLYRHCL